MEVYLLRLLRGILHFFKDYFFSWGWSEAHPHAADDKDPPGKGSQVWADAFQRQSAALEYDVPTATLETDSGRIQRADYPPPPNGLAPQKNFYRVRSE